MNSRQTNLQAIGHYLRATRQEQGLDLYDVSDRLRIRPGYLFALEEGDFDAIPGSTYALGFVRSYAECLGFDGEEVVLEVKKHLAGPVAKTSQVIANTEPLTENRWPTGMAIVGSLAVMVAAYGVWVAASSWEDRQVANVGAWPGEVGAYLSQLIDKNAPSSTITAYSDDASAPTTEPVIPEVASSPRYGEDAVAATLLPEMLEAAEPAGQPKQLAAFIAPEIPAADGSDGLVALDSEALGGTPTTTIFGANDGTSRITLIAKEASWIQVQSSDQTYRWTRILEAGEQYFMPNRRDLALWTGNAGGLEVIIDGRSIGALGDRGAVIRDVILLPEELLAGLP